MSVSSVFHNGVQSKESHVAKVQQFFRDNPEVKFVRFQVVDLSSSVRLYVLPKTAAIEAAERGFILSAASPFVALASSIGLIVENIQGGFDEVRPDWSSLRACTYYPSHSLVMCFVRQAEPDKPKNGYELDPRSILTHQVNAAADEQLDILVGLEIEFYISDSTTDFSKPPAKTSIIGLNAMRNKFNPTVDEIVLAMEKAGIRVNKYHPEDGVFGLYEIVLAPLPPVQAADTMVYCHDLIKTMCQQKGFSATVSPHPFEKGLDIGSHINISISEPDHGNSEKFLAGILGHFRGLCALMRSSYESYARGSKMRPWVFWGDKCKPCPIHQRRRGLWEIRVADATMNPYIAFAAIIAAGLQGIRSKQELTIKGEKKRGELTEEVRKEMNITNKLPLTLKEALTALEDDELMCDDETGLGSSFVKALRSVQKGHIAQYKNMSELERRLEMMMLF